MLRKPKNIREYLKKTKTTIRVFAEQIEVTEDYVYKMLNGSRGASTKLARRIHKVTGIPLMNILYPNEDKRK